ncbi:M10 family metallopeptidase C-terminal domain-containing protein, partial [Roseiarcus sp.]|uniref:M10 family metallopeptidase C-terminal domain-containing protein n=1 Tax=Roseiarcus sp. TaxID=1969460 RepID=UPI003D153150
MATSAEIQMIRNADPGAILPGIDTPTGNPDPASSLMSYTQITQNAKGAPYYYVPAKNEVIVTQSGAVLSGINFGSATLAIEANNVTVQDCTFTATASFWTIDQTPGYSGATIEDCTFQGSGSPTENNVWINAGQSITIKDNSFLDSPGDAIDIEGGVVTGNYFSGAGFLPGAHADAIQILAATGPTTITDNFIDGAWNPSAPANANSDIRIVTEGSNISNVNISGNYLLGGAYAVEIGPDTNTSYTFSNVSVSNNYIGFSVFGPYYGNIQASASIQGNTLVAYANPTSSAQALAAYKKTAMLPANVIAATAAGQVLTSTASAPTTLLGNGLATTFVGSTNETNFVSGYGAHRLLGGEGANIFTYLAISDSTYNQHDNISNFDPAKDVIDLSRIDANITTPGLQHFTFIGTAPFSGTGAQVRYQLNPATNQTFIEADLAGDSGSYWPDFEIVLSGLMPLTAANFALTAAQSTTDIANGTALIDTKVQTPTGAPLEYAYTNVKGKTYSSYEAFDVTTGGVLTLGAEDLNLSSTKDQLLLFDPGMTVTRGG